MHQLEYLQPQVALLASQCDAQWAAHLSPLLISDAGFLPYFELASKAFQQHLERGRLAAGQTALQHERATLPSLTEVELPPEFMRAGGVGADAVFFASLAARVMAA